MDLTQHGKKAQNKGLNYAESSLQSGMPFKLSGKKVFIEPKKTPRDTLWWFSKPWFSKKKKNKLEMAVFFFSSFNSSYDTPILLPLGTIAAFGLYFFSFFFFFTILLIFICFKIFPSRSSEHMDIPLIGSTLHKDKCLNPHPPSVSSNCSDWLWWNKVYCQKKTACSPAA